MLDAIAPVGSVDQALKALASHATDGPGAAASAAPAGIPPVNGGASPEMQQRFESLMQRHTDHAAHPVNGAGNVVTHMIERQQGDLARVEGQVQGFLDAAPNMGASEVVAASMAVSRNVAVTNLKLQIATSITQGSNKSLQTLLKNQ